MAKKSKTNYLHRYFVEAVRATGIGMFCALILGMIFTFLAKIPMLSFLGMYGNMLSSTSPVVGGAVGAAIALALDSDRLAVVSSVAVGALAYSIGGPLAAYVSVLIGAETGGLLSGRTRLDLILVPPVVLIAGGVAAKVAGPPIGYVMKLLEGLITGWTNLHPILMGIAISVVMGLLCTSPLSAVPIAVSLGLSGVAAGAATVGCCVHMLGFGVTGYRDNGIEGLIIQALGTSMFQAGNVMRRPLIIMPEVIVSAILGPVATTLVVIENTAFGAGMGTSGLVGVITAFYATMGSGEPMALAMLKVAVILIIAPILLTFLVGAVMKKQDYIKKGEMTIYKI